ncbi:MAG: ribbon-helix-helix protein, CopG family [Promethearchaeota archaeon]
MNELENNHTINDRITIAIDEQTKQILNQLNNHSESSRSETIRKAIKFYHKFKKVFDQKEKGVSAQVNTYLELLSNGEHIILDVDHYLTFLKFIENSPNKDQFDDFNKSIGRAHAEEFSHDLNITTVQKVVERLEACNFFKIIKDSSNKCTLLLGSDIQKNFIKTFLEEVLKGMGFKVSINEGFSKLKIIIEDFSI